MLTLKMLNLRGWIHSKYIKALDKHNKESRGYIGLVILIMILRQQLTLQELHILHIPAIGNSKPLCPYSSLVSSNFKHAVNIVASLASVGCRVLISFILHSSKCSVVDKDIK
jgi:hypothetical protein